MAKTIANVDHRIRECLRFIEPTVVERMAEMERHGKQWHDKPVSESIHMIQSFLTVLYVR